MAKQERSKGKSYQDNSQQENYLDGQTRGTTKNIGEDWREIGDSGKKNNQREEK